MNTSPRKKTDAAGHGPGRKALLKEPPMLRESRKNGVSSRTPSEPVSAYRQLTAGEIAAGLHGLSLDELKAVEVYEARHHGRRSVLDAVREARRALVHEHASASF